jgi:sialate O-acetylesterase
MKKLLLLAALAVAALAGRADVKLPRIFSDHAVLQRDRPLPVWGWADPGEEITVTLSTQKATVATDADGKWLVKLAPQPMSKEPLTLTVAGKNTITARNVLLGDVWLCGGQSNMEWGLGGCDAPDDIRAADFPLIRHFGVGHHFAATPQTNFTGDWRVCTPQAAPGFTAVGYYFARRVHRETGVPIGLLRSCVGGTGIELWMSQETLLNTPALEPYAKQMRESLAGYQRDLAGALPALQQWLASASAARHTGQTLPMPPAWPEFPFGERAQRPRCVTLHNGMIAPLGPFALRGALWYQGESNAGDRLYLEKKRALLADWRKWFGDPELPFYYVLLAAWQKPNNNPAHTDDWAIVREQQLRCLTLPNTGMASALDVGDADDIHPKNKADVGERLALWALAKDYGMNLEPSGPLFSALKIEDDKARLSFTHLGKGLMVGRKVGRAPATEDAGGKLKRFAIAGEDKQWRWAEARLEGDTVVCSSPDVPKPVAVRYAWAINPEGANLYNRDGLPAAPFRTDTW